MRARWRIISRRSNFGWMSRTRPIATRSAGNHICGTIGISQTLAGYRQNLDLPRIPVDFSFTEEQQQLRRSVREFAEGEIAPHRMEWDETSHFPMEIMPKLAEMGLLGVIFPEEYGGANLGYIEYAIAIEELSRVDGSVGLIVAGHNSLCSNHIFKFGKEAQKKKNLVLVAQGKKIGAWSLTEPETGADAVGT